MNEIVALNDNKTNPKKKKIDNIIQPFIFNKVKKMNKKHIELNAPPLFFSFSDLNQIKI